IRVVALNNSEWERYSNFQRGKKQDPSLFNKSFLQEKIWRLPPSGDRLEHTTEIKIDPLPTGKYLLIAATQTDLFNNECAISITPFQVSAISLLQLENEWFALNRESGLPITGATFQFYNSNYSGNQIRYEPISGSSGSTKQDGSFSFQQPGGYYSCIRVKFQQDELWLQNDVYGNMHTPVQNEIRTGKDAVPAMLFYTDRKLYRPAQIVFWKGIGIGITNGKNSKTELLPEGTSSTVLLMDANNQAIDSVTVQLNSFGSCSGQFVLPSKGLTGRFSIVARGFTWNNDNSIVVEEYKRPGFSIEWKKINKTYSLKDSIPITGSAISYAGNKLQGIS
ncbi:MAG: hypothetical protein FGM61_14180, partial [Sediminibacterium sp.]|nr:hypothetical protein [Sediminibacterium sp.]